MIPKPKLPKEETCHLNLKNIPRTLRDHFKARCALRRVTVRDRLIQMMREDVQGTIK
jgi:hypothetical protein